ncbi:hypothetical protein L6Q21_08670 [Sandaracinobacter sp. RS1-74]|uniref:hypothetical protein n=1 Tax=Sandaracinobacteroides sayramensis TaxID=2913411 RepID=UPI001EDC066F|nr:hypothetical protein [Sandaracinobacteroides sayramensis]MCG2841054.1 hypothetical protein [Sandaracinobacteroides sayramensis]
MSFILTSADLNGLTEQQLRAKRAAILSDLAMRGLRLEDCPHVQISLRCIDEAILRLKQRAFQSRAPRPPKGPGF